MTFNNFNNPQVAALPGHLKQYIVDQQYEHYTPVDQAIWRYVMRQNYSYLKDVAYYPYIPGLKKAGLTIERIPDLQEMNDALAKIGWGAVTVDGFIPPAAFMEYQAYRVLVVAADIRQLKHIEYTPAPDIIHESAGHAPIIAEKDYNEYLNYFGKIGTKAMFSSQDFELYEAIRALSILKEMESADADEIAKAEELVAWRQQNLGEPSEMALLSRLHWWTVEYGLIGTLKNPKIYGAGLLSSIGESVSCMKPDVKKLWYTSEAVNYPYDITKPQPQLFVTPDFQNLVDVLEEYTKTMSFKIGGAHGLFKAMSSKNTCTAVYSSGLAVSGTFTEIELDANKAPNFLKTSGPTALSFEQKQLKGHGKDYHRDGFSSPVGFLKDYSTPLEHFTVAELRNIDVEVGKVASLEFAGGIVVGGLVKNILSANDKIQLITFENCTVKSAEGKVLFEPAWGDYDMAVGAKISSVYGGAADKEAFEEVVYKSATTAHKPSYDQNQIELHKLYSEVRKIRKTRSDFEELNYVWNLLFRNHPDDWLCPLEILEILEAEEINPNLADEIKEDLLQKAQNYPELKKLIEDGFYLLKHPVQENYRIEELEKERA